MIDNAHLFTKYAVIIAIRDRILGGVPTTDEIGKIADKLPVSAPVEDRQKLAEDKILESTCTFLYDDHVSEYYVRDANLVSMMREAADVLQFTYTAKQLLQHGVVVKPSRIYLAGEISGHLRRPVHVEVRGIKQSTVKVNTFIEKPTLTFEIWVGKGRGKMTMVEEGGKKARKQQPDSRLLLEDIRDILLTGCEVGLGACRAQQWGKFDLIEFGELS